MRISLLLFLSAVINVCSTQNTHWWRAADLRKSKAQLVQGHWSSAYRSLVDKATDLLHHPPYSVMNKTLPAPSGNQHDYTSIAIYEWPCNATPAGCKDFPGSHDWRPCDNATGMPWRSCDGIENKQAVSEGDEPRAGAMQRALQTLALAYFFSNNSTYANQACKFIDTWFLDPSTYMTPYLKYGQSHPGTSKGSGSGMIEWTAFPAIIDAAALLEGASCYDPLQPKLQAWWNHFFNFTQTSLEILEEELALNNHGTWFDSSSLSLAYVTNNTQAARTRLETITKIRIFTQIKPSGQMPQETARTKGASYSMYNLEAFTHVAVLASYSNVSLWHYQAPGNRSIRQALDFLLPYATGKAVWPYSQIIKYSWDMLALPLRHASIAFTNSTYEKILCSTFGSYGSYLEQELNLITPPLYNVSEAECKPP
eukprot:TRINITY_DN6431_c0_g1_i1.p1 TRINITY_DN6431_c0_g1~~TRINITY_DN6431_c0_g1_i1.p1  ORF type:complete len:425 (+),score=59.44 TRINITY_DN6431_c0_g1_i1:181-1455(+)